MQGPCVYVYAGGVSLSMLPPLKLRVSNPGHRGSKFQYSLLHSNRMWGSTFMPLCHFRGAYNLKNKTVLAGRVSYLLLLIEICIASSTGQNEEGRAKRIGIFHIWNDTLVWNAKEKGRKKKERNKMKKRRTQLRTDTGGLAYFVFFLPLIANEEFLKH